MIWAWITVALILSFLPLINKKIDISYYIWLLIPIDAYGIIIANAALKPYMIYALILPVILYAKNKGSNFDLSISKGQLLAGIISILIATVNSINSDSLIAVKTGFAAIVVYGCAQLSASCTKCDKIEQLTDVFVASSFGCGIVYLLAYLCMQNGINIDGIIAEVREDAGIFMQTNNMVNGTYTEIVRMRGFAFDPNTMFVQFIFGISACISSMFKKLKLYHIITLVVSILCIILSSSRMGLICAFLSIAITSVVCIIRFDSIRKKVCYSVSILGSCAALMVLSISQWGQSKLSSLLSAYSNRSGLTDEYGRFSVWKECISIYWNKSPILGIGFNNMKRLISTERMTHNTWLQFICECGIIVGSITVIYFFAVMIIGWAKMKHHQNSALQSDAYLCLAIGYTVTIVSLISVDNYTCSYLWFAALLLLKLAYYKPPTPSLTSS